ncbi:unnamed protein product [Protopolystoma xenopodis]|uniref:Uncharacterized protein n=1 Tax=Protopolystoma xenopodis TaxID=117903 RepID=A0A448WXY7_9PLAT|nr:unnamed protein product [Protopolystoma xenopodis]
MDSLFYLGSVLSTPKSTATQRAFHSVLHSTEDSQLPSAVAITSPFVYIGFDMARVQKSRHLVVLDRLHPIADACLRLTGIFFAAPPAIGFRNHISNVSAESSIRSGYPSKEPASNCFASLFQRSRRYLSDGMRQI